MKTDSLLLTRVNICVALLIMNYCCKEQAETFIYCSQDGHYLNSRTQIGVLIVV